MAGLNGMLVRLAAVDVPALAEATARWRSDTEYARLLDDNAVIPITAAQSRKNNEDVSAPDRFEQFFVFQVQTLADDRIVGFVSLDVSWHEQDAWIGIGIGDRDDRGKGYGTEVMKLALRFAFDELNLYRVSLGLWADNERAFRSYKKAGFNSEGIVRDSCLRDGRRWNSRFMGILQTEWRAHDGNG